MSTKIYNGFRVTLPIGKVGFNATYDFFRGMIEDIRVLAEKKYTADFLDSFYMEVDRAVLNKRRADFDNTIYCYEKGEKRGKERFGFLQRYSGAVTIYSYNGSVFFTHFFDGHIWDEYVKKHKPAIEYFGYWDNTDPDEEVSEEEWEYRKEVWDNIFPGHKSPAETGFTINAHSEYSPAPILDWKGRVKRQPSKKGRIKLIVERAVHDDKFEEIRDKYLIDNNMTLDEFNNSKSVSDFMAVDRLVYKSITQEEIKAKTNFLNLILPSRYTEEQLQDIFGWND